MAKKAAKKTEQPKEQAKPSQKQSHTLKIIIVIAVILILWLVHFRASTGPEIVEQNITVQDVGAAPGDLIAVHYIGTYENGTVFDTSREQVAKDNDLWIEERDYAPLQVQVGSGSVIKGFDDALVGMDVGDTKKVTIAAEDAYGAYDPSKVERVPRKETFNRTLEVPRQEKIAADQFEDIFGVEASLNLKVETEQSPWPYKVVEMGDPLTVEVFVSPGDQFELPGYGWKATVDKITDDFVRFYHMPKKGHVVQTTLGAGIVTTTDDEVILTSNATVGDMIMTLAGPLKVSEVTDDEIVLDLNHPLAGSVLIFDLERTS